MDEYLLGLLNQYAGHSRVADAVFREISGNILLKGAVVAAVLYWLWYQDSLGPRRRSGVISALLVACLAIFIGRVLALTLPFSLRPIHTPGAPVNMPFGLTEKALDGWSSMPSDHAVMYFAIATAVFQISRKAGLFLMAHAIFLICLPRVYLGLHWPSDILVGTLVGVIIGLLVQPRVTRLVDERGWVDSWLGTPQIFYPVFFLVNLQIATMFNAIRDIVEDAGKFVAICLGLMH